jgi:diguanylate cyclase (GGDEF)-like protein/PAS domain S-box-containing protein
MCIGQPDKKEDVMGDYLQESSFINGIYKTLFEHNPDACYAFNTEGKFIMINDAACQLTGYSKEELLQLSFPTLLNEDRVEKGQLKFQELLNGKRDSFEISIVKKSGENIDLHITTLPLYIDERIIGVTGIAQDITHKNIVQLELAISRNQLKNIFESIEVCFCSSLPSSKENSFILPVCEKIYGYSEEEFEKNPSLWLEVIHPEDLKTIHEINQQLVEGKSIQREYRIIDVQGDVKWVLSSIIPVINHFGETIRYDGVIIDISHHRELEEKLRFMAYHDTLTKLPNRRKFFKMLGASIQEAKETNKKLAVLFIDLDHFKLINDTLGHRIGDELLQIIAKRIINCLGKNDIVSRQSGDEFTVLLEGFRNLTELEGFAKKLHHIITKPVNLMNNDYTLTASIGISVFPEHSEFPEDLLKDAEHAMYLAKSNGKNAFQFYQSGMSENLTRTMELGQSLLRALRLNEFSLNYQPIINSKANNIVGLEALLRWKHSKIGFISPVEFIPIAENLGVIIPIGEWILRTACTHGKQLHDNGYDYMYISVNVSAKQFEEKNFVPKLINILNETNFNSHYLKIEITESTVMKDLEDLATKLRQLEVLGIDVLLDDFGTGYSSLSYLRKLPISTLKIDRSFIQDIHIDADQEAIIRTIVTMAKSLRMGVIAEGVELENQMSFLQDIDCFDIQGFLYSKPIPFETLNELLQNWNVPS